MTGMAGSTTAGEDYDIEVTRGVTFRAYGIAGMESCEAAVEEGVITLRNLPDEMGVWQARAWAALLLDAADELERGK